MSVRPFRDIKRKKTKVINVGDVMVLFMFVIKMLDTDQSTLRAQFTRYLKHREF